MAQQRNGAVIRHRVEPAIDRRWVGLQAERRTASLRHAPRLDVDILHEVARILAVAKESAREANQANLSALQNLSKQRGGEGSAVRSPAYAPPQLTYATSRRWSDGNGCH